MRKLRALSYALSVCIILSITCGPISVSATYNTLDDMEIDPWGDLDDIQGYEPPTPELAPDDFDPVTMFPDSSLYFIDPAMTATITVPEYWVRWKGSSSSATVYSQTVGGGTFNRIASAAFNYEMYAYEGATLSPALSDLLITIPEGFTELITISGDWSAGKVRFDGTLSSYMYVKGQAEGKYYPYRVDIVADGQTMVSMDLSEFGTYVFNNVEIDLQQAVTSLGYKFYYTPANLTSSDYEWIDALTGTNTIRYWSTGFNLVDDVAITVVPEDENTGLLKGIVEWLKSIRDGILELPQNIANFILEGLQGLFIPDQEELTGLMDRYDVLFEERLGFIYQMFSFVVDSFITWIETMKSAQDYSFTFPGISFPYDGGIIEIVPEQEVSLDNAVMDVLRPVLGTIVSIVCVLAFTNTCFDLVIALMSGQSYMEFIGRKREELDV